MAKRPDPGDVKTRLCPPLSADQASDLAVSMLADLVTRLGRSTVLEVGIAFSPDDAESYFSSMFPLIPLRSQGAGSLGDRMARVSGESIAAGQTPVILLGSDLPRMTVDPLLEGLAALSTDADVAILPALDGGYSGIALCRAAPELFRDIPWSDATTLDRTLDRARDLGLKVHLTEPVPDCDTPSDLRRLIGSFRDDPTSFHHSSPNLALVLERLAMTVIFP